MQNNNVTNLDNFWYLCISNIQDLDDYQNTYEIIEHIGHEFIIKVNSQH